MTGISYLSRAQESVAKVRLGTARPSHQVVKSSSSPSVADTVFVERIRSRIKYWRKTCESSGTSISSDGRKSLTDFFFTIRNFLYLPSVLKLSFYAEELINSLRNIFLGSEQFRSRPCMTIDVCSERQVQLILEV